MAKRNSSGRHPASAAQPKTLLFGRVTAGHGRHYVVTLDTGEQLVAHRRGKKGDVAVGTGWAARLPSRALPRLRRLKIVERSYTALTSGA